MRTIPIAIAAVVVAMATLPTRAGDDATREAQPTPQAPAATAAQAADPGLISRGDSVFHGKLGNAICATCHGANAKGLPGMGPDLTDKAWLHGDGSVKSIETIVRAGVPKPKKSSVVMPPFGGVPLDSAKVAAVAAYVHSLGAAK